MFAPFPRISIAPNLMRISFPSHSSQFKKPKNYHPIRIGSLEHSVLFSFSPELVATVDWEVGAPIRKIQTETFCPSKRNPSD